MWTQVVMGDRWEGGHRLCWGIGGRVDTGCAGGRWEGGHRW